MNVTDWIRSLLGVDVLEERVKQLEAEHLSLLTRNPARLPSINAKPQQAAGQVARPRLFHRDFRPLVENLPQGAPLNAQD